MTSSKSNTSNAHFIMIPLMSPGHTIPIIDMSKLIAKHGATVTVITTTVDAARFKPSIDRAAEVYGLDIRLYPIKLPATEVGLPEGCENLDMLPSLNLSIDLFRAVSMLQEHVEKALREMQPQPSCIISDMGFSWTTELAKKLKIPRIVFDGTGSFSLLCLHNLETTNFLRSVTSESEPFAIPDLPHRVVISKAKLPKSNREFYTARQDMIKALTESFGIVVNSFEELDAEYFERYKEAKQMSVWCVGPVSLCSHDNLDKGDRGSKPDISGDECLKWLDLQKPNSVIYACLGSLCVLDASQIMELALGLEASRRPFILTVRGGNDLKEVEKLIEEDGFEERVKGQGLIIWGWAPQVLIFSHSSVGGFLTHCGWNSILEGLSAGLPMVTCPMFWEQFLNEEYIVNVLQVGTRVKNPENLRVNRDDVKRAVELVMAENGQGKAMRERAQKFKILAHEAMEEHGSSEQNMRSMIRAVIEHIEQTRD